MKANQAALALASEVGGLLRTHASYGPGSWRAGESAFGIADTLSWRIAGRSFNELLDAWKAHGYRPTLRNDTDPFAGILADLYDYAQTCRGQDVKAFRAIGKAQ